VSSNLSTYNVPCHIYDIIYAICYGCNSYRLHFRFYGADTCEAQTAAHVFNTQIQTDAADATALCPAARDPTNAGSRYYLSFIPAKYILHGALCTSNPDWRCARHLKHAQALHANLRSGHQYEASTSTATRRCGVSV
jgi:hypothetical protein